MALRGTNITNEAEKLKIAHDIFAEYGTFLYAVIRSKVENDAQADDLYQDFFLSLVSSPPPGDIKNIKGYLYKAIINDIIDTRRQAERYNNLKKKYAAYLNSSINKKDLRNAINSRKKIEAMFRQVRGHLSPNEMKALILKYQNGLSLEEIAEKMNLKKETIGRYISVGLKKIRKFLEV